MFFEDDATRQPWEEEPETAKAVSAFPLDLAFREVEFDHTPEGAVAIGTFHADRMISRFAAPTAEVVDVYARLTREGAHLLLVAREKDGGLDARLNALVPYELAEAEMQERRAETEPWKASIPSEEGWQSAHGGRPAMAALPLGSVVRVPADRRHPDSLEDECRDMLVRIVRGDTHEIVDRLLGDL